LRSFCSRLAGTGHEFKIEITGPNKITQSPCGFGSELAFRFTHCVARLRRIESNKPHIRPLMMNADCVTVDHVNVSGIDWRGNYWA
jgi:hypothetical protein